MRILLGLTFVFFFHLLSHSQTGLLTFDEKLIEAKKWCLIGNYEKALSEFLQLAKESQDEPQICFELARVYDVLKQEEKALEWARKAHFKESNNVWYSYFLIELLDQNNLYEEAIEINQKNIQLNPSEQLNWDKKLYFQIKAGRKSEALITTTDLVKKFGNQIKHLETRIQLMIELGQSKKAEQELLSLLTPIPSNSDFHHLLADFYLKTGEPQKSTEIYKKIIALYPKDSKATFALLDQGNEELFEKFNPVFSNSQISLDDKIKSILPIVQKAVETKDLSVGSSLQKLCLSLLDQYPPSAKLYALAGDIDQINDENLSAINWYKKSINLDPGIYQVWEMLWYLQIKEGQFSALIKSTQEALNFFPFNQKIYYLLSFGSFKSGNLENALEYIEEALLYNANEIPFILLKTFILLSKKDIDRAELEIEALILKYPKNIEVKGYETYINALRGKSHTMDALLSERSISPSLYYFASKISLLEKDYENSELYAEEYFKSQHQDFLAEVFEIKGDLSEQKGELEQAQTYWKLALEKGVNSDSIKEKIKRYAPK
jgi:tetratricopeptide (TPR) repeat protein